MRQLILFAILAASVAPLQQPDGLAAKPQPLGTPPAVIEPFSLPLEGRDDLRKKEGATGDPEDDSGDDSDSPSPADDDSDGVEFEDASSSTSKRRFGVLKGRSSGLPPESSVPATSQSSEASVLDDKVKQAVEQHIFGPMSTNGDDSYSQKLAEATLRLDRRTLYSTLLEELSPNATSNSATSRWVDAASTRALAASVALTSAPGWRSHLDSGASYSDAFLSKRGIR